MSSIQFCRRKSLSFPFLGITSPSVFDAGYKSLELTGYRKNLSKFRLDVSKGIHMKAGQTVKTSYFVPIYV